MVCLAFHLLIPTATYTIYGANPSVAWDPGTIAVQQPSNNADPEESKDLDIL
jgi:hypothetical protein